MLVWRQNDPLKVVRSPCRILQPALATLSLSLGPQKLICGIIKTCKSGVQRAFTVQQAGWPVGLLISRYRGPCQHIYTAVVHLTVPAHLCAGNFFQAMLNLKALIERSCHSLPGYQRM